MFSYEPAYSEWGLGGNLQLSSLLSLLLGPFHTPGLPLPGEPGGRSLGAPLPVPEDINLETLLSIAGMLALSPVIYFSR